MARNHKDKGRRTLKALLLGIEKFQYFVTRRKWGRIVFLLSNCVLFWTVYMLILPAAAISGNDAGKADGFYLEGSTDVSQSESSAGAQVDGIESAQEGSVDNTDAPTTSTVFSQEITQTTSGQETALLSAAGWEPIPSDSSTDVSDTVIAETSQTATEEIGFFPNEGNESDSIKDTDSGIEISYTTKVWNKEFNKTIILTNGK